MKASLLFLFLSLLPACARMEIEPTQMQQTSTTQVVAHACERWWEDFGEKNLSRCVEMTANKGEISTFDIVHRYLDLDEKIQQRQIAGEILSNRILELDLTMLRRANRVGKVTNTESLKSKVDEIETGISEMESEISRSKKEMMALTGMDPFEICSLENRGERFGKKVATSDRYRGLNKKADVAIEKMKVILEKLECLKGEIALNRASHDLVLERFKHGLEKLSKVYQVNEQFLFCRVRQVSLQFELKHAYADFILAINMIASSHQYCENSL